MYCWQCRARLRPRARTCRRCGAALDPPLLPVKRRRLPPRLTSAALTAACVLGLLAAGAAYLRPPNLRTVPVPDLVGLTSEEAIATLAHLGLIPQVTRRESGRSVLWNRVLQQSPSPGLSATRGERVSLLVYHQPGTIPKSYRDPPPPATGSRPAPPPEADAPNPPANPYRFTGVPNVVGQTTKQATAQLARVGLTLRAQGREHSARVRAGRVLRQSPAAGRAAPHDDLVRVVVSSGKAPHSVSAARRNRPFRWEFPIRHAG